MSGQVHVVDRQHLADDVENAVGQHGPHLFELFEQPFEDAAFDDGLAFLGLAGHEIEGVDVPLLADAVDAAEPLLQAGRVPRQVVVDHQPAELEVDAFAGRLGRHADLLVVRNCSWARLRSCGFMPPWISAGGVAPLFQCVRRGNSACRGAR